MIIAKRSKPKIRRRVGTDKIENYGALYCTTLNRIISVDVILGISDFNCRTHCGRTDRLDSTGVIAGGWCRGIDMGDQEVRWIVGQTDQSRINSIHTFARERVDYIVDQ